jgi:heme/copper-type cytochrome/quinol oxidase subunit 2
MTPPPISRLERLRRSPVMVAAVWLVAIFVVLVCGLVVRIGATSWGDGYGPPLSHIEVAEVVLTAVAALAVAVAVSVWSSRR